MNKADLPEGWVIRRSRTYPDKQYYFHPKTRQSSWEPPCANGKPGQGVQDAGETGATKSKSCQERKALFLPRQLQSRSKPPPLCVKKTALKCSGGEMSKSGKRNDEEKSSSALPESADGVSSPKKSRRSEDVPQTTVSLLRTEDSCSVPKSSASSWKPVKPVAKSDSVNPVEEKQSVGRPAEKHSSHATSEEVSCGRKNHRVSHQEAKESKSGQHTCAKKETTRCEKHAKRKKKKSRKYRRSSRSAHSESEQSHAEIRNKGDAASTDHSQRECKKSRRETVEFSDEDSSGRKRKRARLEETSPSPSPQSKTSSSLAGRKILSAKRQSVPRVRDFRKAFPLVPGSETTSGVSTRCLLPSQKFPAAGAKNSQSPRDESDDSSNIPQWVSPVPVGSPEMDQLQSASELVFTSSLTSVHDFNNSGIVLDEMEMEVDEMPAVDNKQEAPMSQEKMDEGEFLSSVTLEKYRAASESGKRIIIVIDTCAIMDDLGGVKATLDKVFANFGLPIMVVPWVVVQELDVIKDNKKKLESMTITSKKQAEARAAVRFLSSCFEARHPRFVGQPAKEAKEEFPDLIVCNNDDRVLQCCLQCQDRNPKSCVLLLSRDINLCNKAAVLGFDNYTPQKYPAESEDVPVRSSSKSLEPGRNSVSKTALLPRVRNPKATASAVVTPFRQKPSAPLPAPTPSSTSTLLTPMNNMILQVKSILKESLDHIVEEEVKESFGEFWKTVVPNKMPWSAVDVVDIVSKHFRAVFGFKVSRTLEDTAKTLLRNLKRKNFNREKMEDLLSESSRLLAGFAEVKEYSDQLRPFLAEMRCLQNEWCHKPTQLNPPSLSQRSTPVPTESGPEPPSQVKADLQSEQAAQTKFQVVWEIVHQFCQVAEGVVKNDYQLTPDCQQQQQEMLHKLPVLLPLLQALYQHFAQCLAQPLDELPQRQLCSTLNQFCPQLDLTINNDVNLSPESLAEYFLTSTNRSTLQTGLVQLEEMLNSLLQFAQTMQVPI